MLEGAETLPVIRLGDACFAFPQCVLAKICSEICSETIGDTVARRETDRRIH